MMIDDLRSVIDDLRNRFASHIYIIEEFHISKISNHQSQIINNPADVNFKGSAVCCSE